MDTLHTKGWTLVYLVPAPHIKPSKRNLVDNFPQKCQQQRHGRWWPLFILGCFVSGRKSEYCSIIFRQSKAWLNTLSKLYYPGPYRAKAAVFAQQFYLIRFLSLIVRILAIHPSFQFFYNAVREFSSERRRVWCDSCDQIDNPGSICSEATSGFIYPEQEQT